MALFFREKKTVILLGIIVFLLGSIIFFMVSGPFLIMELFFPGNIIPVDVVCIDDLFVLRTNKIVEISDLILAGEKVSPCLLSQFIELDMELNAMMQSFIVEEGFLVAKDKI